MIYARRIILTVHSLSSLEISRLERAQSLRVLPAFPFRKLPVSAPDMPLRSPAVAISTSMLLCLSFPNMVQMQPLRIDFEHSSATSLNLQTMPLLKSFKRRIRQWEFA